MSLSNTPTPTRSVASLAAELSASLVVLRDALRVTLSLCDKLEHHVAYITAIAQGQPVRIKPKPEKKPPTNGQHRGRGRPPGAKNNLTLFVSPAEIARLRAAEPP